MNILKAIFLCLVIHSVAAQNRPSAIDLKNKCRSIDLRNELGSVRNQDGVGWCFAYASADLIGHKIKRKVSATDTAFIYDQKKPFYERIISSLATRFILKRKKSPIQEGGLSSRALKYLLENGVCLENDLPSDNIGIKTMMKYKMMVEMGISSPSPSINKQCKSNSAIPLPEISGLFGIIKNWIFKKPEVKNDPCPNRLPVKEKFEVETIIGRKSKMINQIDKVLERGDLISITYSADILVNPTDVTNSIFKIDVRYLHESSIVGRHFNERTNQCEYIIRNSWGRSCNFYVRSSLRCEQGNIFVPRKELLKTLIATTNLKP